MEEITLEELQKLELEIMDEIHKYCIENNIKYYLGYGTLIGAVRHKGYIPWDDDIDIFMMRKDYNKFIKEFSSNKGYKVISIESEPNFYLPFAKVINTNTILKEEISSKFLLGVFVDIFPLDEVPIKEVKKFYRKQKVLNKALALKFRGGKRRNIYKKIISFIAKLMLLPFSKRFLINKIIKHASKYMNKECEYVGSMVALIYNKKDIWKKEFFNATIDLPFENRNYLCPKEYDKVLSNTYGDYMELPPKERQVSSHNFKAYWKK